MGFGIAFGQMLAGFVGPVYGWRLPFVIVSIPAFFCAALMMFTLKEPPRGGQESSVKELIDTGNSNGKRGGSDEGGGGCMDCLNPKASFVERGGSSNEVVPEEEGRDEGVLGEHKEEGAGRKVTFQTPGPDVQYQPLLDTWETFKLLFKNKTAILLFLQGIPGCLPWGLVAVFMNDYLSDDCGLSVETATLVVSMFGIGAFFGLVFGGTYGQYLYNRNKKHLVLFFSGFEVRE